MQPQLYNPGVEDNAVQTFDFNGLTLRALLVEGEARFIAKDVADVLGYGLTGDMLRNLDEDEKGMQIVHTPGGPQQMATITESGLYSAILRSRKPEAKAFKRWVTHDVLPAIRKTGSYGAPAESEDALILRALTTLQGRVDAQAKELEQVRPKAEVYDRVLTPEHTFGFRDLCKTLREHFPVNENDVKRVLREKKILTPPRLLGRDRMDVYSAAIDKGWAVRHPAGKHGGKERFQVRFTTQTLEWLLDVLAPLEEVA